MNIGQLVNKKIAILGYGVNNQSLVSWLIKHGAKDITIRDKNLNLKNQSIYAKASMGKLSIINYQLGEGYLDNLDKFDIIFRTPGIPYLHPKIQEAKKAGVEISSQTKLFFKLCPAKIIGVTGTKGKGTTSTLIYEMLKIAAKHSSLSGSLASLSRNAGTAISLGKFAQLKNNNSKQTIYLAGNIGNDPFVFLDKLTANDWVILELSSFQLQDLDRSPHIAVVLNITSDHLDYHSDNSEYINAKTNIVRYQRKDDFAVINQDYLTSFKFAEISPTENDWYFSVKNSVDLGAFIKKEQIILRTKEKDLPIIDLKEIKLPGKHNLENICAAITASFLAGVEIKYIKKTIANFTGLQYRIQLIAEKNKIKYYNDSASTNPDTTIAAIKSFKQPIILIAGGSDKGVPFDKLGQEIVKSKVKKALLIGKTAVKINNAIKKNDKNFDSIICESLKKAMKMATHSAKPGEVILFSPASASFDMFRDYKDRGEEFNKQVKILK